jgi:hypothetical protein
MIPLVRARAIGAEGRERTGAAVAVVSPRLIAALPAILLLILLAFAFRGALAGRMFYLRDVSQNHYPVRHFVTERLRAGALPLWDPYHGGGTPLLADPNNLVLHPISALFLILPFDAAYTASIVLQFALLALGGYLLARAIGARPEGAAMAAAIVSLSGPAASLASLQNVLCGAAWVPIGLWALLRGVESGQGRFLALGALCFGVVLAAAEPASIVSFTLLAPILGLTGDRSPSPSRGRVAWRIGAVLLVGLLIAGAQVLPAGDLLSRAARGAGFTAPEAWKWSLRPARLLEVIVPRLLGDPTRMSPGSWWGRWMFEGGYPFLLSLYVGAIPCLLAAAGLLRSGADAARRRALAAAGGLGLLLALGQHSALYRLLLESAPALRQIRYPERFVLIALVPLALLAARGLDLLLDAPSARRLLGGCVAAAGAAFAGVTVIAAAPGAVDRFLQAGAAVPPALLNSEVAASVRGALLQSSLWTFFEAAALALCAAAAARPLRGPAARAAAWAIVAASGLSMSMAAAPALSTAAPGWLAAPSPLAGTFGRGPGAPRLHHDPRPADLSVWGTTDELVWGFRFDRFTYSLATAHADRIPTIMDPATDRMDLKDQADLGRALARVPLGDRLKILSICHAGFLLTYDRIEHPDLEAGPVLSGFSLPPLRVFKIRRVLPRARFRHLAVAPTRPGDVALSLADPGYDPWREVLLEGAPAGSRAAEGGGGGDRRAGEAEGQVAIVEDEPEEVRLRASAPRAGYLVLADAHAPGWTATVDGAPAPVLRADGLFRAVYLEAGEHEVVMSYRPLSVRIGLAVSLVGLFLAAAWSVPRPGAR